jgi:hypothetical protein
LSHKSVRFTRKLVKHSITGVRRRSRKKRKSNNTAF